MNYVFHRINKRRGSVVPTLTATASSDWHLRDARGVRVAVALEVGGLHGYPRCVIEGLLRAARAQAERSVRSRARLLNARADAIVRRAMGDGFMLPVVEDNLFRMLRARLRMPVGMRIPVGSGPSS